VDNSYGGEVIDCKVDTLLSCSRFSEEGAGGMEDGKVKYRYLSAGGCCV
jgi:hypothetical protein